MMRQVVLALISVLAVLAQEEDNEQEQEQEQSQENKPIEWTYDNDVLVLDEGSFQPALEKFEYLLLEFYAPWCGHCQKLAPEYEKAAKILKEEGIVLAKVDASVHRKLAEAQGVNGYPTLKFVTQGKEVKFEGGRTADGIQQWIWSHINPGSEQLNSLEQVKQAIESNDLLFFYFADDQPKDGKDREFRRYKEFSYTIKATKFAHTHHKGIREEFKIPRHVNLVCFKNRDNKVVHYNSNKLKIQDMKTFVEINQHPRVLGLDEWTLERMFVKEKPVVISFDEKWAFTEAAFTYPHEEYLLFVKVGVQEEGRKDFLQRLQIKEDDAKGVFLVAKNGTLKFKMNKELTKDNVLDFINDWKEGKAPRYLKSQDTPQEESSGPVRQLVGSTYQSLVLESNQDVVVLYYDSKNEEHNLVQKQFEQTALRLQKNNLIFAKIDCSQNEVPDMQDSVEVTKIRLYKGEREFVRFILRANKLQEERLVKWVRENSKQQVADPKGDL